MEQLSSELSQKKALVYGRLWSYKGPVRAAVEQAAKHYLEKYGERFLEIRLGEEAYMEYAPTSAEPYIRFDPTVLPDHIYMILADRKDLHEC